MNRFILKIFLFTLPLALVIVMIEYLLQPIPNLYLSKYNNFVKNKNQIKILILGNSHTHAGINPNYLSMPSYNLANGSQPLLVDLALLEREIPSMTKLEIIIIPISYFTLWYTDGNKEITWNKYYYLKYYNLKLPSTSYEDISKKYSLIRLFGTKSSIRGIFKYYIGHYEIPTCDKRGWGYGYPATENKDFVNEGKRATIRHEYNDMSAYKKNVQRLEQICTLAKANNKKIIFISVPTRPEYRVNLNQQKVTDNKKVIQELQARHSNAVYLDFESDAQFSESDFYDADHLNFIGANKFTKILDVLISQSVKLKHLNINTP
jgi:hypothetical protein